MIIIINSIEIEYMDAGSKCGYNPLPYSYIINYTIFNNKATASGSHTIDYNRSYTYQDFIDIIHKLFQ